MTQEMQDRILTVIKAAKNDLKDIPQYINVDEDFNHPPTPVEWHICPQCAPRVFARTERMVMTMFMAMVADPNPQLFFVRMYLETIAMTLHYAKKGDEIDELYKLFHASGEHSK